MNNNTIIHVSETNVSPNSGMGRVEYYWKEAFERAGYNFIHIGPNEVGALKHPALFPYKAYQYFKKLQVQPTAFIIHEPAAAYFIKQKTPCFIESHGVERRYWQAQINGDVPASASNKLSFKTKLLFPLWRLRGCDKGLKYANKLLLINSDDKDFVKLIYKRSEDDILVFKNGVNRISFSEVKKNESDFTVLFNGSWLERKGIMVLVKAASQLFDEGFKIKYLLIGTGKDANSVIADWPSELQPFVKVVNKFDSKDEPGYLSQSSLFVLPSYFEGQPLSLLQAMAAGKCCVTTNCCGQKDIIKNTETGFLFEPGNHQELAKIIGKCYKNPDVIVEVAQKAKQYADKLSWESVSEEVVNYVLLNVESK